MTKVRQIMTQDPVCLDQHTSCGEAAKAMADHDIGTVLVQDAEKRLFGIVTDRDLTIRCLAAGKEASANMTLKDVCSAIDAAVDADDDVEEAIHLMRERAVRRIPVMDEGKAAGIVSLGDLAIERDPNSVLGRVSASQSAG